MLVSDYIACRFATTSRDHRLPFHGLQLSAATPLLAYRQAASLRSWVEP